MAKNAHEPIPTRSSLLSRIKNWDDGASWQDFCDTYGNLIHGLAVKSGLTSAEADDVVQETYLRVAKSIKTFRYDPVRGSFKGWLCTMTRRLIIDQVRKRQPAGRPKTIAADQTRRTRTEERVADPRGADLEAQWEQEWQHNLLAAALTRVKRRVDAGHYQIFDLHVNKGLEAHDVARRLGVTENQVYLVKHRITGLLRKEVGYLKDNVL